MLKYVSVLLKYFNGYTLQLRYNAVVGSKIAERVVSDHAL